MGRLQEGPGRQMERAMGEAARSSREAQKGVKKLPAMTFVTAAGSRSQQSRQLCGDTGKSNSKVPRLPATGED